MANSEKRCIFAENLTDMNKILFFMIALSLVSCGGRDIYNDLKQQNLHGEIKQVRMTSYSVIEKFNERIPLRYLTTRETK